MAEANCLDLAERCARVWRSLDETEKFIAEQHKAIYEDTKQHRTEAFYPGRIVAASVTATAALIGGTAAVVKLFLVP